MATKADIEAYLLKAEVVFEEVEFGTWLIRNIEGHGANMVVRMAEPIIVFRAKIVELPADSTEAFMRKVLEMNAREMVHASFGLEQDIVVAGGALALENLDYNEFQAMLDDLSLAVSEHKATLKAAAETPSGN